MTHTPAASSSRPAQSPHAATPHRAAPSAEPPRQQAETRAARDRFAAKLERDQPRDTGKADRGDGKPAPNGREPVAGREDDRSGLADLGADIGADSGQGGGNGDAHPDFALTQPAAVLSGPASITAPAPTPATPLIDPAMLERMAAQIAEQWPGGGIEAARIQFPEGAIIQAVSLTRQADGTMAIRLTGLDPRFTALQSARLQVDLANALTRRRLRIGALEFEKAAPSQRESGRSDPGAASAIDRVV
jgi:hypothetical protein